MPLPNPHMTPRAKINFSRLRDIGWSKWDPIGLLADGQNWEDEACLPFAGEYDSYLLQAAGQPRRGAAVDRVVAYLVGIEANNMGLGTASDASARAKAVVTAIQADTKLWRFPG